MVKRCISMSVPPLQNNVGVAIEAPLHTSAAGCASILQRKLHVLCRRVCRPATSNCGATLILTVGVQVADEHGLETQLNMPQAGTAVPAAAQQQAAKPDADLSERLAQLRGK